MKSARRGSDSLGPIFSGFLGGETLSASVRDHDRWKRQEVKELAAELAAKKAREAKRNRPIKVKTFSIE